MIRRHSFPAGTGWQAMATAPRDGTIVEVCCTFGIAPWYGLYRWTGKQGAIDQHGKMHEWEGAPTWVNASDPSRSVSDEAHLHWRPAATLADTYIDPTGGAQDTNAYWLQAAYRATNGLVGERAPGEPRRVCLLKRLFG